MQQRLVDRARANWVPMKLGDLFINRKIKGEPGLPTYSVTMNERTWCLRDSRTQKRNIAFSRTAFAHRKDDIAYNMMRMWQGASGLAPEAGLVSPAYVVLRSNGEVDPLFASYWFKMPRVVKEVSGLLARS